MRIGHPAIAKGVITGAFTGLAAIPGLYYALVVQPVQRVEDGQIKSVGAQTDVLRAVTSTGRILFGIGLLCIILLIAFIIVGFRLQNNDDIKKP
jgi:hypothetical protein